jgi:hypothetical protein
MTIIPVGEHAGAPAEWLSFSLLLSSQQFSEKLGTPKATVTKSAN